MVKEERETEKGKAGKREKVRLGERKDGIREGKTQDVSRDSYVWARRFPSTSTSVPAKALKQPVSMYANGKHILGVVVEF